MRIWSILARLRSHRITQRCSKAGKSVNPWLLSGVRDGTHKQHDTASVIANREEERTIYLQRESLWLKRGDARSCRRSRCRHRAFLVHFTPAFLSNLRQKDVAAVQFRHLREVGARGIESFCHSQRLQRFV